MRNSFKPWFLMTWGAALAAAAPAISGIWNAGSWAPPGLTNSNIAQGSIFVLTGSGMGPAGLVQVVAYPVPKTLAGTSIQVTIGSQPFDCLMVYTVDSQVAAILPSATPLGSGTLALTFQGARTTFPIRVVQSSFGMFTINQRGSGPGVITDASYQIRTPTNSAHPGDTLIGWGTGLGGSTGDESQPPPQVDLRSGVEVFVGNLPATVVYGGRGSSPGLDQVNFVVPDGVSGCYVSVAVRVRGVIGNFTTLPIAPPGQSICSDPAQFTTSDLQKVQGAGTLKTARLSFTRIPGNQDRAGGDFGRWDFLTFISARGVTGNTASRGNCAVYETLGDSPDLSDPVLPVGLDAGPSLTLNGPRGSQSISLIAKGSYDQKLGGGGGGAQGFLDPGNYTLTNGSGGADVGRFTASFTMPQPINWTNRGSTAIVTRGQDLPITWSGGGANDLVAILGLVENTSANTNLLSFVEFLCLERAAVGQFSVPALVTSLLPLAGVVSPGSPGVGLAVSDVTLTTFAAPGIDTGYIAASNFNATVAAIQ